MRYLVLLAGLTGVLLISYPARASEIWIDVDTAKHTLSVMQGDVVQAVFENVAIGRFGTTWYKKTRDDYSSY